MGIQDFATFFDQLDAAQKGFITVDELAAFVENLFYTSVSYNQVESALLLICGPGHGGKVFRDHFLPLLEEISRRKTIEEQAYWDFQALDCNGSHRIKVHDALTLFQEYHGDAFSLYTWHKFLKSRLDPGSDVCFDEIREWLCSVPSEEPATQRELKEEKSRVNMMYWQHYQQEYNELKVLQKGDEGDWDEEEKLLEDTRQQAQRKLRRWNRLGLDAMLNDDGLDAKADEVDGRHAWRRDAVSAADLLDALEIKYCLLQDFLIHHMAASVADEESDRIEIAQRIRHGLARATKSGMDQVLSSLPASSATVPMSVFSMMGDLPLKHEERLKELKLLEDKLRQEGKSPDEVEELMKKAYHSSVTGFATCGQVLADLMARQVSERETLLAATREHQQGERPAWQELCRLQRQLIMLKDLSDFFPAAVAVGLAERQSQPAFFKGYDCDRERSEILAKERLKSRQGQKLIHTTTQLPDINEVANFGKVSIRNSVVSELELRHYLEREALIMMLQGNESHNSKIAAQKLSQEDRQRRIVMLRGHHLNWKMGNTGDSSQNFHILTEAAGIYWVERQSKLEEHYHNITDETVNASVLADLQQQQERDFALCLHKMEEKKNDGLIALLKEECSARYQEHFNNVASVILGLVEVSSEDKEFSEALSEKYRAIREQIFVFALKEKFGLSEWTGMDPEGRLGELIKLSKEEEKLRGDGNLVGLSRIIGPKSQALPTLAVLLGENKGFWGEPGAPAAGPPVNLLADLVPRLDLEQERLLDWLHSPGAQTQERGREKVLLLAEMEVERFCLGVDGDLEAALLTLGLTERLRAVLTTRSLADKEKQQKLAARRLALHRLREHRGEVLQIQAEDRSLPKRGDKLSYQRALLREMLHRQVVERELLLRLIQDSTFLDLVEAARQIEAEPRWQRLAALAENHGALNLSTRGGREEAQSMMEEAAALRTVGLEEHGKQAGKVVSQDETAVLLLTQLQDIHDGQLLQQLLHGFDIEEDALRRKLAAEVTSRQEEHATSVMTLLTRVDRDTQNNELIIKLLEEKYSMLKEALLLSLLRLSGGDKLSSEQRDQKLKHLKSELGPLWDKGDSEGMARLLGRNAELDCNIVWTLGPGRGEFIRLRDAVETQQTIEEFAVAADKTILAAVQHLMKRFNSEQEYLLAVFSGSGGNFLTNSMKASLRSRLKRETNLIAAEEGLMFASLVCGLAERQPKDLKSVRLEKDVERYSLVGRHEFGLRQSGRKGTNKNEKLSMTHSDNRETLQDAVLYLLMKKHQDERQILTEMLVSPRFEEVMKVTSFESTQQRRDRLVSLRAKHHAAVLGSGSDTLSLLHEALVVFREEKRWLVGRDLTPTDDVEINSEIMATLLLLQNVEAEQYLCDWAFEEVREMIESQEKILDEISKSKCQNIASLVFSLDTSSEDEAIVEALGGKYDVLRDTLLAQALIDQLGQKNWQNMSEKERQKRLLELKMRERQLLREGKFDELASLLGEALNNEATLRKLMGDSRDDYEAKLKERRERRRLRLAEGMTEEECDKIEREEEEKDEEQAKQRRCNVLQNLQHNFDAEREALLKQLRGGDSNAVRERQKKLLQLRLDQRRLHQDQDLQTLALLFGFQNQVDQSKAAERKRQERLAAERLDALRQRKKDGRCSDLEGQLSVIALDLNAETDPQKLRDRLVTSLHLHHQAEIEFLVQLMESIDKEARLPDPSSTDLTDKLGELKDVFYHWRNSGHSFDDGSVQLLKEALRYRLALKQQELSKDGKISAEKDVQVSLLTDLQMIQEAEVTKSIESALDLKADHLHHAIHYVLQRHEQGGHDNVAKVVLSPGKGMGRQKAGDEAEEEEGETQGEGEQLTEEQKEEKVVKALERKYDAIRDKLIIEAFIQQHGEAKWKRMSELERQRRLVELKRKERKLRSEGKMDEVDILLGQYIKHKTDLSNILGESAINQKARMEERLARRRHLKATREAQGLAADEAMLHTILEQEEEMKDDVKKNILEDLQMHFEEEKQALLSDLHLHGEDREHGAECQRVIVQLQHDCQQLRTEEQLETAVLLFSIGLQKQQEGTEGSDSMLKQHERQRQLARERLAERKTLVLEGKGPVEDKIQPPAHHDFDVAVNELNDGVHHLQEALLMALDKHQACERETLLQLLARCHRDKEVAKTIGKLTIEELQLRLEKSRKEHTEWKRASAKEVVATLDPQLTEKHRHKLIQKAAQRWHDQMDILERALLLKLELEHRQLLSMHPDARPAQLWEEQCIVTLTLLQEQQARLSGIMKHSLFTKDKEELHELRKAQKISSREGWFESLTAATFKVEDMSAEEGKKGEKGGSDVEAVIRQLENQYKAKTQQENEAKDQQRAALTKRLEALKRQQSEQDLEAEAVVSMLRQAHTRQEAAKQKAVMEHGLQKTLLEERLQKRRDDRRRAANSSPLSVVDENSRSSSATSISGRSVLSREKTAISATVSESQQKEELERLRQREEMKQQTFSMYRQKQQEDVQRRLKEKKERTKNVVAALLSIGEQQRTSLEQAKKGEMERQRKEMGEHINRVRYERTMTRKPGAVLGKRGYMDQGLEEGDEVMEHKAWELEQLLRQSMEKAAAGAQQGPSASEETLLTDQSRMDILKERRRQRKLQKTAERH